MISAIISFYYRTKYKIFKPEVKIVNGMHPVSYTQQELIERAWAQMRNNGKSDREIRRIIKKKLRIEVIPDHNKTIKK